MFEQLDVMSTRTNWYVDELGARELKVCGEMFQKSTHLHKLRCRSESFVAGREGGKSCGKRSIYVSKGGARKR